MQHQATICPEHGHAVSCVGEDNAKVLVGTCSWTGHLVTTVSDRYIAAHRAGTAEPLDVDAEVDKHLNRAVAHMFNDDGSLKAEFADPPRDEAAEAQVKIHDEQLDELNAEILKLPPEDREGLLMSVQRRVAQVEASKPAPEPEPEIVPETLAGDDASAAPAGAPVPVPAVPPEFTE